jgi:hypothetical protein
VTGSDLLHPALPFATLLFALAYLAIAWPGTEGKSWRQHLPELAVLALRRASAVLILAGSVGALLSTMIDSWFVAAALALAAIAWGALAWNPPVGRFASDSAREASVYLAEAALASAYLYVRHGLFGAPFGPNIVTAGAVIAASLVLLAVNVIAARSPGAAPLSRASYRTALALPLALLFVTPRSREATTMSAFSAGAFYMIVAQRSSTRWALYCAALLFNVGLYVWLPAAQAATGLMQLYVIPAATTVLILAQLHRHDLSPPVLARVRTCAAAAILAAATVEVLNAPTMLHFALMLASTLLGIAAGIALRVRVIVLVGVAFLVANVVLQLGLHMRTPTGVMRGLLLITVGLTITAAMVFLNLKRSELLRRYRAFVTDPSWE